MAITITCCCLNHFLLLFSSESKVSEFSNKEIINLIARAFPSQWKLKFNLDGYVLTLNSKAQLIEVCETIEHNVITMEKLTSNK
jgi:hypothetical protein